MALSLWTDTQIIGQLDSGYSWNSNTITYAFPTTLSGVYYVSEGSGFQPVGSIFRHIATVALTTWDDLISPDFQLTTSNSSDIEFASSSTGVDWAHAYYPTTGSAWFNNQYSDLMNPEIGAYAFKTLIHELGHALGLNHMGDYENALVPSCYQDSHVYSIMSYFGADGPYYNSDVAQANWTDSSGDVISPQTPMINDILAIQSIYGAETNTRIGNTVYGFNSNISGDMAEIYDFTVNENPVLAIYDSGGIDTLDLSGFSTKCRISLVAGTFSDCNRMTFNLSIAYLSTIENAVGGAGNDTITGNEADNILTGGRGNDTISGGGGTDIAIFAGAFASYTVVQNGTGSYTVTANSGTDGTDTLTSIEILRFSDRDVGGSATAPVVAAAIADQSADTDTAFSFTIPAGSFTDPNGDVLTYTAKLTGGAALPSWLSFNATTRTFSGTPDAGDEGTLSIVVTASDGSETASDTFSLVVGEAGGTDIVGTSASETIPGTDAGENIYGLAGRDTITAGAGDDHLIGGTGMDELWGEAGADTFVYSLVADSPWKDGKFDTIMDFSRADGDVIDLSGIDANATRGGNQAFRFVGKSADLSDKGQIDYWVEKGDTYVYGYTDNDKNPEFYLVIDGVTGLKASDFVL